ncbi:unnamed protein product [Bursaphelenchus xylophilus]|uniref:(pine wood nematode) hypothetical protein n=1 Tax=Bursaphelenchus xylophilus TaxID=6326 RepID=A0A1I7RKN8_BURXY|nr:unnamed protein product [Bursaphelenchus xylophilus]CAG9131195.1 unnamed protein product [Bursaphelenchus xylophilus]
MSKFFEKVKFYAVANIRPLIVLGVISGILVATFEAATMLRKLRPTERLQHQEMEDFLAFRRLRGQEQTSRPA